ncbi:hypothetical protein TEA_020364 [Camellia sinensis var. sinensis]|uniref:Cyclin N-terminal domain-containing protein n=1 Tax=Camellia sinensis var. sinensis TaxID=542762 RepID=A0A4S4F1X5_CAMSN|nr:hypothetical protein TEA_020364 [Camellia sinensis var. sinensis]
MINRNIVGAYPYPGEVNKRPALNNAPSNKNHMPIPPISANRPITRKFAAKMAGKQKQPLPEEVEMENTTNKLVADIESSDKRNPLAVAEYINDIYAYYKKVESSSCVLPNYMGQQFDINERMRGILIDWLIEDQFDLQGNPSDVASFLAIGGQNRVTGARMPWEHLKHLGRDQYSRFDMGMSGNLESRS